MADSGKALLHYRILEQLGEGGMGVVYRAEDTRMGRVVALKVLRAELAADEEWNRRFEREVRLASSFSHPGVATLYDYQSDGATRFYTMEFVEGRNLREILRKGGSLPIPRLIGCAIQVAEALAEAHRKGIVHRDLKPENVMESASGYFKILDFGLARSTGAGFAEPGSGSALETMPKDTTQAGRIVGTVAYMSPEQAQGLPVDTRSDIFAFGSLFHELATGEAPFKRHSAIATFHAIVHEPARSLRELRPEAPPELEWILARCLEKDPKRRYQDASELVPDLRALQSGADSGARGISAIRGYPGANVARSWQNWGVSTHRWAAVTWGTIVLILALIAGRLWLFPPAPDAGGRAALTARESAPPAAGAAVPVPLASAVNASSQRSIAVSPFVNNTGDTGSDWLVQGIPEMITTSLAGTGDLTVISTQRLNDLMAMAGRDGRAGVDGATATELARWAGASIVVSGSIYRADGRFRIDAQAYDTATGQILAVSRAQGGELFDLVDRVTDDLKQGLQGEGAGREIAAGKRKAPPSGEAVLQVGQAPAAGHPATEEAYRFYVDGINDFNALRFDEGIVAFTQALEADPGFVPAQARLGMSLVLEGDPKKGLAWIARADEARQELPDRERRIVRILRSLYDVRDTAQAEEAAREFAAAFPEDQEGWFWLAQAKADVEGDHLGAVRVLSRIVREQPDNLPAVALLGQNLAVIGSTEEAVKILEDYRTRFPRAAGPLDEIIKECRAPHAAAPPSSSR